MTLLSLHAAVTWFMAGLIWFVQIVHYPLFLAVGEADCVAYALKHQRRTSWVVGPPMLLEATLSLWIVFDPPAGVEGWQAWLGLALLGAIWGSTAFLQVPCHRLLAEGFGSAAASRLVANNWIRTVFWTTRGILALAMLGG